MKIRKATKNDISDAARIYRENMAQPPYRKRMSQQESCRILQEFHKHQVMLIAEQNAAVAGFIVGDVYLWVGGWRVWVSELFVDQNLQQKGVGTALIQALESHFKNKKPVYTELLAHHKAPALQFYKKRKFQKSVYVKLEKKV